MKTIFENKPYKITFQHKPDTDVINVLKHTRWGTKETVYQHQDTEHHIHNVPDPLFFSLTKDEELIGTCCFSKRSSLVNGQPVDFWYSRYFSIDSKRQGGIFGSMILKHIRNYFDNHTEIPTVFYAYVDASNIRSRKLLNYIGFKKLRSFETLTFSRPFPKKQPHVTLINATDKNVMLHLLKESYKRYLMADFQSDFCDDNYYVLKNQDEIIAGIRATKAHWVIRSLSGFSGKVIMKILPHVPIVRKLFNPNNFRFLAFDGIYVKEGHEKQLFVLMEGVCNLLQMNIGIMWLDDKSDLYERLRSAGNWGIMDTLKEKIPAHVVGAFKNISTDDEQKMYSSPAYISSIDII